MRTITQEQLLEELKGQGVSAPRHYAFKCVICGTVQSAFSLVKAGVKKEEYDRYLGFSCEGRFTGAGAWPSENSKSKASAARRKVRGCDWTLGGLFSVHKLEVAMSDTGKSRPCFEIATPEEAQGLERAMTVEEKVA